MASPGVLGATRPIDRAVVLVLLTRLVPLVAAPVTLWLVATRRPLSEQGPYFVFWNTQALTQLMELGIGGLIVQFASHESTGLVWDEHGGLAGDHAVVARMLHVLRQGRDWYGVIALGLLVIVGLGGIWLFYSKSAGVHPSPVAPWVITVVLTAGYLPLVPVLCAIEGSGGLLRVQRMRLVQMVAAMAALWAVLPMWGALWAVAMFALVWFVIAWGWLNGAHQGLLRQLRSYRGASATIDPPVVRDVSLTAVQWRTGIVWLAWWAAPQTLTPIVLAVHGPASAGRVGMTLAIATAPLTLASAWLQARYPRYGALVARGNIAELRHVARVATLQALVVCAAGTAAATVVVWWLARAAPTLAERALPAAAIATLGVANLAWLVVQSLASYLRAWREEPLMESTLLGALLVTGGALVAAIYTSARGAVTGYSLAVLFAMFPLVFLASRRRLAQDGRYGSSRASA
jgi:hypothetical protein